MKVSATELVVTVPVASGIVSVDLTRDGGVVSNGKKIVTDCGAGGNGKVPLFMAEQLGTSSQTLIAK
jgi:hypothetical protein